MKHVNNIRAYIHKKHIRKYNVYTDTNKTCVLIYPVINASRCIHILCVHTCTHIYKCIFIHKTHIIHILLLLLFTAIELSLVGSSPYTSTDKTNKKKYT